MIQENKEPCKHLKNDEYYICVNGPCLKNSIYKLSCHQCLLEDHQHPLAIQHIDQITNEALTNQRELIEYLSVNLDYCQNKKEQLVSLTQEIKQQIYQQLDTQQKLCQQQIDLYQQTLLRLKQQIDIPELSKNLDQILGLKLFDRKQFLKDNIFIKSIVDQNILMFQSQVPSINPSIYPIENDELPNLTISFLNYDKPKYQVCQKNHDLNVAAVCIHEQCLHKISLKCPVCLTLEHQGKDHSKNIIFNKLEEEYKVKLSELESFCKQKAKDVWKFFEEMPKLIQDNETIKQKGLLQFKQFIYQKGKEILKNLERYYIEIFSCMQKYRSERNTIYPQLFVNKQYSKLTETDILYQNFEEEITWFKQHFMQIKEDLDQKNIQLKRELDKQNLSDAQQEYFSNQKQDKQVKGKQTPSKQEGVQQKKNT